MIHIIILIFSISVGCIVWQYVRYREIMQLGIFFNFCAIAYFALGLSISMEETAKAFPDHLQEIGWMAVVAVIGFNLAYMFARSLPSRITKSNGDYLPSRTTLLIFVGIGLLFELSAILVINFSDYFLTDRNHRFMAIQHRTELLYIANLMDVCLPMAMARYFKFRNRKDRNLFYFLFFYCVLIGITTISRFDLTVAMICLLYFLDQERILRTFTITSIIFFAFFLTIIFKPALYPLLIGESYLGGKNLFDANEYTNWIHTTLLMMTHPEVELPHNGYLLALKSLFVISPEQDALSEWYLKEFYYEQTLLFPGTARGFTGVWEGYSTYSLAGVGMHFAFFGAVFGILQRTPTAMRHIFIIFAMILTHRLFRSEVYNFVKTYAWYYAYPIFAIVLIDKFLLWSSRGRTIFFGTSFNIESPTRHSERTFQNWRQFR